VGYEIIKWRVYFNRPNNLEDLLQRIQAEMEQISLNLTLLSAEYCRV
jgi:hypothetical protein